MALIGPFDLRRIFVVDLAGTPEIFSFVAILLISFAMGKFGFTGKLALPLFALFVVIMAAYLRPLYVLVILIAGIVTYFAVSRMVK